MISEEMLQSQFAVASLWLAVACLLMLHLVFAGGAKGWVWLAAAAFCAWGFGYEYADHSKFALFFPDDSAQVAYDGLFIGDAATPASSALWLRYALMSAVAMALTYFATRSVFASLAAGGILLPVVMGWLWQHDGWLVGAGFYSGGGAGCVLLLCGSTVLGMRMHHYRLHGTVAAATAGSEFQWHLIWIGLAAMILACVTTSARAIDVVWIAMTASHLLVASAAAAFMCWLAPRFTDNAPAIAPACAAVGALCLLCADPLSYQMYQSALAGVLAYGVLVLGHRLLRRYGDNDTRFISVFLLCTAVGCFGAHLVNPLVALYIQSLGVGGVGLFSIGAGVALSIVHKRLPQRMQ